MVELRHRIWRFIDLGIDPYISVYRYQVTASAHHIKRSYAYLERGQLADDVYSLAGRLIALRRHGKIVFGVLHDGTDTIQLVFRYDVLGEQLWKVVELLVVGDIIGVRGKPMRTLRGELSLLVEDLKVLSITWRDYPEKWHGLTDAEKRYRMRYLDMMLNEDVRRAIVATYRIEKAFRDFLDKQGFIEIHTPKLQPIYGGALARPFITRMYALDDRVVYLSIAPETYLKRAVVANFFKVYEIAVCFRNEDIDAQHYPEFVQIEIYQAFADWNDMMRLVEDMVSYAIKETFGDYRVEVKKGEETIELDFRPPWQRLTLEDAIERFGGVKVKGRSYEELVEIAKSLDIRVEDPRKGKILEKLFEKVAEPKIVQPTFITLFPRDVSPLARPYREDPRYSERFEIFINGLEVGNGYSELNNPIVQYYFFKKEEELRVRAGEKLSDIEYHPMDRDYVRALEFGMPPTAGVGIGIYRLVMAVTGLPSIKDVIPFTIVEPDETPTIAELHRDILEYYVRKLNLEEL
ncbi:MAG TPA: lysine--tRNA ligase [Ignisphaera aggregans]|uniref:Lysine--tRNA ligase n=1 Tax=Ignisphaera aggregans TaxID=334771 RepID=A0A833DTC9_9CREN|nr:lysine--tRNA ligase [Ignisphaera aggregans]